MSVVREHLVCHWIDILSIVILQKVQFDQVGSSQRFAVGWVGAILLEPAQDMLVVEDRAVRGTHWCSEGLK